MPEEITATGQEIPPIWEYVPTGEFKIPSATLGHTVKGGIAGLWQRLRPARTLPPGPPEEKKELLSLGFGA